MALPLSAAARLQGALASFRSGQPEACIAELRALASQLPAEPELHNALGAVLAARGHAAEAAISLERVLELQPEHHAARTNLGNLQLERGELAAAIANLERAIGHPAATAPAYTGLGRALCLLGRHREALAAFAAACARPRAHAGTRSQHCYASLLDPGASARERAAIHRAHAAQLAPAAVSFTNSREPQRKLRLAYVSADFREHSVASFLEGVLVAHDRERFEIYLYSDTTREDAVSARLFAAADHVERSALLSHAQLAAACRERLIDVAIDLAGHMQPNRLPAFAARPAPVCFTYLGYPGSTGSDLFDARLTDSWADPQDDAALGGPEPLVRIAGGYLAFTPPRDAPAVATLPSGKPFVFGCFNDAVKINPRVCRAWAAILRHCPEAMLLLKTRMCSSPDYRHAVMQWLGVDPQRVEFLAATPTRREHLETYACVDLALDTFPYAGATTTCEALYMGVPVITLAGEGHAERLGVSILSALGMTSAIARDEAEYIELAQRFASDRSALVTLRASLRERMLSSPLCDGRRVARAIEHAAHASFERWAARSCTA